ncbi:MAG: hypothetical protein Q9M20_07620 [Mariprofundaceae bacterium]|nr:hypothetical protein [Mariprofundaceae bacterium]
MMTLNVKANTFKIIFCGKIQSDHDLAAVTKAVSALLKESIDDVQNYFNGQQRFVRDHLDFVTANRYQRAFAQVGAICLLLPMLECPTCQFRQEKSASCVRCKTSLKFFTKKVHALFTDEDVQHEENPLKYQQKRKATFWLGFGIAIQISALLIDEVLLHYDIDLLWLHFLSTPPLMYGAWFLAQLKGYRPYLALLCLFPLLGLAVLLLLPDKEHALTSGPTKMSYQQFLGGLMIAMSLFWMIQLTMQGSAISQFESENIAIKSLLQNKENKDIEAYKEKLMTFIDHSFEAAENASSRPASSIAIADGIFHRLTDFFMYMQFQNYQQFKQNGHVEKAFSEDTKNALHMKYSALMQEKVSELDSDYFTKQYRNWLLLEGTEEQFKFGGSIAEITIRMQVEGNLFFKYDGHIPETLDDFFPPLESPYVETMTFDKEGKLTLTFNEKFPPAAGKSVEYALFVHQIPARSKYRPAYSRVVNLRIGGDLDDYYLVNRSLFSKWKFLISGEYRY